MNPKPQSAVQKWQRLASTVVLNHRWFRVRRDRVRLPDGTEIDDFFIREAPDIALVLPVTPDGEIVFVRQYRHGVGDVLLELPAGSFDPTAEDAETAAARELLEETGYRAPQWETLARLYDNPVKDTNRVHLFLARGATCDRPQTLDITEQIEVVRLSREAAIAGVASGEICVAGSVAALLLGLPKI